MKPTDKNVLTNSIQYKAYDQYDNPNDLSVCKNVNIKINYVLNENEFLNMAKISNFKNMGVDIFNIKDDFFIDICFPYTNNSSGSDMTLKARIKDLYENVSICDNDYDFESFNLETKMVSCSCKVKEEVNKEIVPRDFSTPILSAFFD